MTYRTSRAADARMAEDAAVEQSMMCAAQGCPNRWSVDAGNGRCCSWHAWSDPFLWPRITQEQQDASIDRARRNTAPRKAPTFTLSREERGQILSGIREAFQPKENNLAWAHALRQRERRGERLTPAQRDAWRAAARLPEAEQ